MVTLGGQRHAVPISKVLPAEAHLLPVLVAVACFDLTN